MIQDHPFQGDGVNDNLCVFGVQRGESIVHCNQLKELHEDASFYQRRANPNFDFDLTYYLAGPMSGYTDYNYPAFTAAAETLRNTGIRIQSPHEQPWPDDSHKLSEEDLWVEMMNRTNAQLILCAGMILLKGWPQSRGAKAELSVAMEKGWPVWYYNDFQLVNMNKDS